MRNQVSAHTLANLLGVSEKAITQLAKRGIIAPAPRGRYHLQASVYSYCAFIRTMIGHAGEVAEDRFVEGPTSKDRGGTSGS
jgi:phage terminase Nu1 subunit (DNA packaging protein)